MTMQEKLTALMNEKKIKPAELSREIGIPNSTLADILKGKTNNVAIGRLFAIAKYFDCSVEYLAIDEIADVNYGKTYGFTLEHGEMELILKYRSLDDRGKSAVDNTLDYEYQAKPATDTDRTPRTAGNSHNFKDDMSTHMELTAFNEQIAEKLKNKRKIKAMD